MALAASSLPGLMIAFFGPWRFITRTAPLAERDEQEGTRCSSLMRKRTRRRSAQFARRMSGSMPENCEASTTHSSRNCKIHGEVPLGKNRKWCSTRRDVSAELTADLPTFRRTDEVKGSKTFR